MRHFALIFPMLFLLLGCNDEKQSWIEISNPGSQSLTDVPVVIEKSAFDLVPEGSVPLLSNKGVQLPSQVDDFDGDGAWDEISTKISLSGGQKTRFDIKWVSPEEYPVFGSRANIYLGVSETRNGTFVSVSENNRPSSHVAQSTPFLYQFEGPAWENELVGFRSYFDSRNGKDIFGKAKHQLCAEIIGKDGSYHELQDWGMDILKVGSSLGAGAIGMYKQGQLYRLGATEKASFKVISDGPVRAIMELIYEGWEVEGETYGLKERITIWGGERWYESDFMLNNGNQNDTLITGIVNLKHLDLDSLEDKSHSVYYTYGQQSENKDNLGMALIVDDKNFAGKLDAPTEGKGITNTYVTQLIPNDKHYGFKFYVGWSQEDKSFNSKEGFKKSLLGDLVKMNAKLDIVIH